MKDFTANIRFNEASGWYVGQLLELPGVISQGRTETELLDNLRDALELYLDFQREQTSREYEGQQFHQLPLAA